MNSRREMKLTFEGGRGDWVISRQIVQHRRLEARLEERSGGREEPRLRVRQGLCGARATAALQLQRGGRLLQHLGKPGFGKNRAPPPASQRRTEERARELRHWILKTLLLQTQARTRVGEADWDIEAECCIQLQGTPQMPGLGERAAYSRLYVILVAASGIISYQQQLSESAHAYRCANL